MKLGSFVVQDYNMGICANPISGILCRSELELIGMRGGWVGKNLLGNA